jgi:hypothetical protein
MADYTIKAGDAGAAIGAVLADASGPVDLSGASVRFVMADAQTGAVKVAAAATITDAAAGAVSHTWAAADLDTAGSYLAEFEVTFGSGEIATFPSAGWITIEVVDDLD